MYRIMEGSWFSVKTPPKTQSLTPQVTTTDQGDCQRYNMNPLSTTIEL